MKSEFYLHSVCISSYQMLAMLGSAESRSSHHCIQKRAQQCCLINFQWILLLQKCQCAGTWVKCLGRSRRAKSEPRCDDISWIQVCYWMGIMDWRTPYQFGWTATPCCCLGNASHPKISGSATIVIFPKLHSLITRKCRLFQIGVVAGYSYQSAYAASSKKRLPRVNARHVLSLPQIQMQKPESVCLAFKENCILPDSLW